MSSFPKTMFSVTFSGAAGVQFGRNIFTTTMPFSAAERFLEVFPDVQRKVNKTRVKAIAKYIHDGLRTNNYCFLSAITATCRGNIGYDEAAHLVSIDINAKLSVNDGQHRFEGIKLALKIMRDQVEKAGESTKQELQEKLDRLESMCIPVVIFDNLDMTHEQQLFHDLNLLANKPTKSVSLKFDNTDLYNRMAKELASENEWLAKYGVETERTSLSDKNEEIMVLSTLRNMLSYMLSGSDKDKNDHLNLDNYEEEKRHVDGFLNLIFSSLPPDSNDRSKYILGTAATLQGIGKYVNYLIHSIHDIDEHLLGLKNINWKHDNPMWNGFGGSYDPNKKKFIFSGTGSGVTGVCNALIHNNRPVQSAN